MEQTLTLFSWFSGLLIILITVINVFLGFKFRRYFRANGFGIVTLTLLSLVSAHTLGVFIFAITTLTIIISAGNAPTTFYRMKNVGTVWLISSSLLHMMGITLQRVFSFAYGKKFLQFTRSRRNIAASIATLWIGSIFISVLVLVSASPASFAVYYFGVFICGVLAIVNFMVTVDMALLRNKPLSHPEETEIIQTITPDNSTASRKVRVVQNPRKTFSLFAGLLLSFLFFTLPICIPNVIYNLRGRVLSESTSIVVALWLFIGIVFDCIWILIRLRSAVNDTSAFFAKWTLGKSRDNIAHFLSSRRINHQKDTMKEKLVTDESTGLETELEHI